MKVKTIKQISKYMLLIIGGLIMIVPFLWMISTALKNSDAVFKFPPDWIPNPITFKNFKQVFDLYSFERMFFNSIFVAIIVTVGQTFLSAMSGYAFARFDFKYKNILFYVLLSTMMVPKQVTLIPLFILMRKLDWINSYFALIVPNLFNIFGIFLMRQFFITVPRELEEAAYMDGANIFKVFFKVIMPLAKPSMATVAILAFMQSWNDFLWPLISISNKEKMTLPVGLSLLQGRYEINWNVVMAGTLTSMIPMLIVYIFAQKYIIRGISHSGLK